MARNGHQRALNQLNKCFFAYFIFGTALPCPLDEAIYDLRESNNFPRTSETLFSLQTFVNKERHLAEILATWEAHRAEKEYGEEEI